VTLVTTFDENKVKRQSAGTSSGGQFAAKQHAAPTGSLSNEESEGLVARGASFALAPFGGFTLTKVSKWRGSEGDGFQGIVQLNGKPIGEIVQEGRGGETYFRAHNREGDVALKGFVDEVWAPAVAKASGDSFYVSPQEHMLDGLYNEYESARYLKTLTRKGTLPVMSPEHLAMATSDELFREVSFIAVANAGKDIPQYVEQAKAKGEDLAGWAYFDGENWMSFESIEAA
jgi:hypothetical protein